MKRFNDLDLDSKESVINSIYDTYQRTNRSRLTGIYFLFDGEELVYIGQALNIYSRIYQHDLDSGKWFSHFAYHSAPAAALDKLEAQLIVACWPTRYNRSCNGSLIKGNRFWYSNGIRSTITEVDKTTFVVKSEYYDFETLRPASVEQTLSIFEDAVKARMEQNSKLRAVQREGEMMYHARRERMAKLGGSRRGANVKHVFRKRDDLGKFVSEVVA